MLSCISKKDRRVTIAVIRLSPEILSLIVDTTNENDEAQFAYYE